MELFFNLKIKVNFFFTSVLVCSYVCMINTFWHFYYCCCCRHCLGFRYIIYMLFLYNFQSLQSLNIIIIIVTIVYVWSIFIFVFFLLTQKQHRYYYYPLSTKFIHHFNIDVNVCVCVRSTKFLVEFHNVFFCLLSVFLGY